MELILKNFKQHKDERFELTEHTILYGTNGTGKTSILEALELFFSDTHNIFSDLILSSDESEVEKLYNGYINNQTYIHEKIKWKTFSKKRGNFSITFKFSLNGELYFVEKIYRSNGYVNVGQNLTNILSIKEFFKYRFIFYKKEYNDGPLSKGEYAIDYILKSIYDIERISRIMKKKNIDSSKYLIAGFDEPDNKIHPTNWNEIYKKVLKSKSYIVVTTTNLHTVENFLVFKQPKVYFFERYGHLKDALSIVKEIEVLDTIIDLIDDEENEDENNKIEKRIIGKHLDIDYKNLKQMLPLKKYVFVEGKSDFEFLELLFSDMKFEDIEVISFNGQDKIIAKEYLRPILNFIKLIQNYSPNIYCILDFDKEGFKYATHFEEIVPKSNIFFINGEKYQHHEDGWDESKNKFTLENMLSNKYIKKREYVPLTNATIKSKLLRRVENLENNDFNFISEKIKTDFINEFERFLSEYFIEDGIDKVSKVKQVKNKSKNLFSQSNGKNKIAYEKLNTGRLNKLKKVIEEEFVRSEKPYEFVNKKYTPTQIKEIKELKGVLNIPDYILKVNSKTISYYKDYNYFKYNQGYNDGIISNEVQKLLDLLNKRSEYQVEESYYTLDEINLSTFEVRGLMLGGKTPIDNINTHKGVYVRLCESLYEMDSEKIKSCIKNKTFNGIRNQHFADRASEIKRAPCKISNELWIETRFSSKEIYKKIGLLLKLYGLEDDWFRLKVNM